MTNLTKLNIALITIAIGTWLTLGINGIVSQVQANVQLANKDSGYVATTPVKPIQLNALTIEALVNVERAKLGLPALAHNDQLTTSACAKLDHMVANSYWAHDAPDGTKPWDFFDAAGYRYRIASENLAADQLQEADVVNDWMASPTHRAGLLSTNLEQGICAKPTVHNGRPTIYTVQHIGTR